MLNASTLHILGYWLIGIAAALIFRHGGVTPELRAGCFVVGNLLGISATWLLMNVYTRMNVNAATIVCNCGVFVLLQLTLWLLFRAPLGWMQWLGLLMIAAGTAMVLAHSAERPTPQETHA
jgi:drug/metabolite transporter (DMT)-like permease